MKKELKKKIVEALMSVSEAGSKSKSIKKAYESASKDLAKKIERVEKAAAIKAAKMQNIANEVFKIQELSKKPALKVEEAKK